VSGQATRPTPSSRALPVYLSVVVAVGALVLAVSAAAAARTPNPLWWMALSGGVILAGWFRMNFASVSATIGIEDTFLIATALLFGPAPPTLAVAASGLLFSMRRGKPARQIAFNIAALSLSIWGGAQTFYLLADVAPLAVGHAPVARLVVPLMVFTAVFYLLNSGLTAVAVGLDTRQSPIDVWSHHFRWLWVGYLGAASAAFFLILLLQQGSLTAAAMILPLLAVFHLTLRATFGRLDDARRHLGDIDRLYLSTVETLAMAIDAKDDVTHNHVRRVQAYAVALARALEVDDPLTIKAIEAAALLHDTGKLAVPEHILNKPGKLTAEEFEQMKLHVDVGADILSLVDFPYPVVPSVRCHHENWDGSGYPRGVRGEDIPIGARILSVVDCFDALTSDRPYRRRMTDEDAIAILVERSGRMYDPHVVNTFMRIHADVVVDHGDDAPEQRAALQRITQSRHEPAPPAAAGPEPQAMPTSLLAFVSLARLSSGEGGVADVLALGSRLLGEIVPGVSGAWFVPEAGRDRLVVSEAFGPAANTLRAMQVGMGERLTGWVAAQRQAILNSDAALDIGDRVDAVSPRLMTCMSVPIIAGDTLVAVLSLYASSSDTFDEDRGRLVQMVAPQIASAMQAAASRGVTAAPEQRPVADKLATTGLRLVAR
jgi:putative nucleotidyltransferase with HDIG domain